MTDRTWLESYPRSTRRHRPDTIPLAGGADGRSLPPVRPRVAYSFMGRDITFAETEALSRALAAYLQGLGLSKGDRVAIMMPNVPQYPVSVAAILRAGFVVVNVNPAVHRT